MKKIILIIIFSLFFITDVWPADNPLALDYLNNYYSAQNLGKGNTAVTAINDNMSVLYNPAVSSKLKANAFQLDTTSIFGESYTSISFTLKAFQPLTLSYFYLTSNLSGFEETVIQNNIPTKTGTIFSASNQTLILNASYLFFDSLSLGGNVKATSQSIYYASATAFYADVGAHYSLDSWKFGAAVLNVLGTKVKWNSNLSQEDVPFTLVAGIENSFFDDSLNLALALHKQGSLPLDYNAGLAYSLFKLIVLSAGYDQNKYTFGIGFTFDNLALFYAYGFSSQSFAEDTNSFSFAFEF